MLRVLKESALTGMLIPNHTLWMTCSAAWIAGMAFALGYLRGVPQTTNQSSEKRMDRRKCEAHETEDIPKFRE